MCIRDSDEAPQRAFGQDGLDAAAEHAKKAVDPDHEGLGPGEDGLEYEQHQHGENHVAENAVRQDSVDPLAPGRSLPGGPRDAPADPLADPGVAELGFERRQLRPLRDLTTRLLEAHLAD